MEPPLVKEESVHPLTSSVSSSAPVEEGQPLPGGDAELIQAKDAEIRDRDEKIVKLRNLLIKLKKELVTAKASQQQQAPNILANNIQVSISALGLDRKESGQLPTSPKGVGSLTG